MTSRLATWLALLFCCLTSANLVSVAYAQPIDQLSRLPAIEPIEPEPAVLEPPPIEDEPIAADVDVEGAVEEKIKGPWYSYDVLFDRTTWKNSVEFGINGTTGNAETISFRAGADSKHKTEQNTFKMNFSYARTQADGEETQNNARLTARNDWQFCDSLWSVFVQQTTDYDEFKAFDVRIAANAGLGYYFIKEEGASLQGPFGLRFFA